MNIHVLIDLLTAIAAMCQIFITIVFLAKYTKYRLLKKENKILIDLLWNNTLNFENHESLKKAFEDAKTHIKELRNERGDLPNF